MANGEISRTRLRRTASIAGGAAGVAARTATARTLTATGGSSERRRAAATRQQMKSAKQLVKLFSNMRGATMKLGQTLSTVDLGLVPEELRPEFQEILATLQQNAEPVPFKQIRKVVEEDLDGKLGESFADFGEQPIAAASIGQVHRATLHDGRDVAVKVQYPGIAEAIHADMQNMRLGLKLISSLAPGIDSGAIAEELRERIGEELDYELEATNQRAMARAYRDHPFIVVPDVIGSLSRERVLVSEFVEGRRFAELRDAPREQRDRIGEILTRFYVSGPVRHRLLNGDPHPGNSLFLDDGRVAFLDFGFFKRLSDRDVEQLIGTSRATYERDADALMSYVVELGGLPPDPALAGPMLDNYVRLFGWLLTDEQLTVDGTRTGQIVRGYHRLRQLEGFDELEIPAEHIVLMRAVMLLIGVVGQLEATANWLDIVREWVFDDEPVTELGKLEAEHVARWQRSGHASAIAGPR